jgi:MFS family permease
VLWVPCLAAFLSSLCLMTVEMVAGRMVARLHGVSIHTWTIIIAVIFAGMSVGNFAGGRLAERFAARPLLGRLFVVASLACASLLWTKSMLADAGPEGAGRWPGKEYRLVGELTLTAESAERLREAGVPADVIDALRPLTGRSARFAGVAELDAAADAALTPARAAANRAAIRAAAVPEGPSWRALREEGVPEELLTRLAPLNGVRFADVRLLNAAALAALGVEVTEEGLRGDPAAAESFAAHSAEVARAADGGTPFTFPVRLLIVTATVFLPPALALGLIGPAAAALALENSRAVGRAMAGVYAWGAWGSVLGTFLSGFVLVGAMGGNVLIGLAALLLAATGAAAGPAPRRLRWAATAGVAALLLPAFAQVAEPTALDPGVAGVPRGDHPLGRFGAWLAAWGDAAGVRDPDRSPDSVESDYQFIRVQRRTHGGPAGAGRDAEAEAEPNREVLELVLDNLIHGHVVLRMPEGSDGFDRARAVPDPAKFEYEYERMFALATARAVADRFRFGPDGRPLPPPLVTLSLGAGPYTFPRYLVERYPGRADPPEEAYGKDRPDIPEIRQRAEAFGRVRKVAASSAVLPSIADVVEIDPMVTEVGHTRLGLPRHDADPRIKTWNCDARNFVESAVAAGWRGRYDVIYLDCFNSFSVPYHLTTKEFNDKVRALLRPGGVCLTLCIDLRGESRFLSAAVTTLRQTFADVRVMAVPGRPAGGGSRRETFVLVSSDRPQELGFLGGATPEQSAASERTDPGAAERLARLGAVDRFALEGTTFRRKPYGPGDVGVVCLSEAEVRDEVIEAGRRPAPPASWMNFGPLRRLADRTPRAFRLDDTARARLSAPAGPAGLAGRDAVPPAVLEKLAPIAGVLYATVEEFSAAVRERLGRAEAAARLPALIRACRQPEAGLDEPIVLTDDFAPVDDLLGKLLEERG